MIKKNKLLISFFLLASCLKSVDMSPLPPEDLKTKIENNIAPVRIDKNFLSQQLIFFCPEGMANIENQFCIDQYEASIIDKTTGEHASPHYIPSQAGFHDSDWQFETFKKMGPIPMPPRGAEQYPHFEPLAVSVPDKIPATYVTKIVAEQACSNAGKRLCTRKEWYQACVGPQGPFPYFNKKGKEIYPEVYPYGLTYEKGKCNTNLHLNLWPPGLLGRKNNQEMLDPRISALLDKDGLTMKQATDYFLGCTNQYGVYNQVGNVHEIVSDIRIATKFPRERVTFVGSHYARSARESCAEATTDHWQYYTDYSVGFRCCGNIQH